MGGRRGLSDEERTVWEIVTRRIKPLHPNRKAAKIKPAEASSPKVPSPKIAEAKAVTVKPVPKLPAPAAFSRREKQRAARGRDRIDARHDLHGHTQHEAHAALLRFLRRVSEAEAKLVLVITGKSGVLRQQVPLWLGTPEFRDMIISTDTAAIGHGGDGALYVRVRRGRR